MTVGRLVMPALRWTDGGWECEGGSIEEALAAGVPGFILFGGAAEAVRELTQELTRRAGRPLLFAADLERGAGQQFGGLPGLPPLEALGGIADAADRREAVRAAARSTARGARSVGVGLVFAPVADVAVEPDNPIVGTRGAGSDPSHVSEVVEEWVAACLDEGVACAVKHWPGHGRTRTDSHAELPVVDATAAELETEWEPFRRGLLAGAPVVMTAHVAYPALDPSGLPATRSEPILGRLRTLGFGGVVVSDALIMAGVGELDAAVREGIHAGVDLMLYPGDLAASIKAVAGCDPARVAEAIARVASLIERYAITPDEPAPTRLHGDAADAAALCDLVIESPATAIADPPVGWVRLTTLDDDLGGPWPAPSRDSFRDSLLELGVPVGEEASDLDSERRDCLVLVSVFAEPRAWKGRAGLSGQTVRELRTTLDGCRARGERVMVICFGGDRIRTDLQPVLREAAGTEAEPHLLLARGGEAPMQRAAARRVARLLRPSASE